MPLRLPEIGEPISVIIKLTGDVCNINCHYCYEKRKPVRRYERLEPALLEQFLKKANGRPLSLELHGGEPLLCGASRMRRLFAVCRRYEGPLRITLQTNATLLDQAWLDLFDEEWPDLEVSTSLDGDPASTQHRVDYRDQPTHEAVERALKLFERNGKRIGVICTVTRPALTRARPILDYFLRFPAINLVKLNPCFDFNVATRLSPGNSTSLAVLNPAGTDVPGWGIRPIEFLEFLTSFFDCWVEDESFGRILVEPFLSVIRVLQGERAIFCVYDSHKCGHIVSLYPDGRLASCDELDLPAALLAGNVDALSSLDDALLFQTNPGLHGRLNEILSKCDGCPYRETCRGGCLATRMRYRESVYYESYCQYRIGLIEHVRRRLAANAEAAACP